MAANKSGSSRVSVTVCPWSTEQLALVKKLNEIQSQPPVQQGKQRQPLKEVPQAIQEESRSKIVKKILVKAVSKEKGKDAKLFTLRNIQTDCISSCDDLKKVIKTQLNKDVVDKFDVGYMQNTSAVSIRSDEDLLDIWDQVHNGKKVILWCDGLQSSHGKSNKRVRPSDLEEEEDSSMEVKSKKKKNNRSDTSLHVEETLTGPNSTFPVLRVA